MLPCERGREPASRVGSAGSAAPASSGWDSGTATTGPPAVSGGGLVLSSGEGCKRGAQEQRAPPQDDRTR